MTFKEGRFLNRPSSAAPVSRPPLLGNNLDITKRAEQPRLMNSLKRFSDPVYCLMRLVVGLLFACHGGQKILGFPPTAKAMQLDTLGMVGGYIELICGFMIALGLLTCIAAFIASGMMAVAYFMVHAPGGFFPIVNRGEAAVLYSFVFFFMFFYGSGRFSLDALLFKRGDSTVPSAA
ncbi:MAG: putative oxidoreductase [Verrucomicrobiota bacterium]